MSSENIKKQALIESHEGKGKAVNNLLWLLAVLLIVVAAVGNTYFADQFALAIRIVAMVILMVAALGLVAVTNQGKKAIGFFKESRGELRKIVWPKRSEAMQTTLIVFGVTVVASLVLWGFDSLIIAVISFITNLRF
ncbi:preprotein translocase subunit SecE [Testudinibacter aquarius]|uniref:Protein translocase subunit SecE n=1 Tax=Testudinibacter aquarius TaxID=1524974 RepID=A0A4R3YCG8_9PAST|nr:preprotein translocase subunit SecE [Testudinibacter aquarius]KAE9525850.1 preprotein translocase subunit SecE [Testudinibacter aquarius]TCV88778.1 protein translocase subunit secE/sec61 gamma [Testudinibacter aquarius]TNG93466.1 preprotein translocase subunit SecE [Testudinibacter aquarius]